MLKDKGAELPDCSRASILAFKLSDLASSEATHLLREFKNRWKHRWERHEYLPSIASVFSELQWMVGPLNPEVDNQSHPRGSAG
mmetsp:Transcript_3248/g.4963  ORF Transcript_3248/g.4963 Transcript_3248/m.4963 type:complete len:84 (+) Transcript_3248:3038-3289(+)